MNNKIFQIYLISDATGNTLKTMAQSCLSQFENIEVNISSYPLISSNEKLASVLAKIKVNPGLVLYTMPNKALSDILENFCLKNDIPCYDILETPLKVMSAFFKIDSQAKPGEKHKFDDETISKIIAIEYALKFEKQNPDLSELDKADIILIGPSRTSKTPTSVYLANKDLKVAVFTLFPDKKLPTEVFAQKNKLVIGLIAKPERLIELRRSKLKIFDPFIQTEYLDSSAVEEEVMKARKLYADNGWHIIDITTKSIEDICDDILFMLKRKTPEFK